MNDNHSIPNAPARPRWPVETPSLHRLANDMAMRAVGRTGALLNGSLGPRRVAPLGILTYHRISPIVPGCPSPWHNVTPERFRSQLVGLLQRGYEFWPLREVLDGHDAGRSIPPRTVVITFDDGFASVHRHAFPVLAELNIPATVFVNTAYLDSAEPFPFDGWGGAHAPGPRSDQESTRAGSTVHAPVDSYRPLSRDECQEMLRSGWIELGAHTHTHGDFRGRSEAFQADLEQNVALLNEWFQIERPTFAFPFGRPVAGFAGGELTEAARRAGVRCALTTAPVLVDPSSDPFHWGRLNVFAWDTAATLAGKLGGWYSWAPLLRQRLVRQ